MEKSNPYLGEAFTEVIWNQINGNEPPITKVTYDRLLSEGFSEKEAIRLLSCVLSAETYDMLKQKRVFNEKGYEKMMRKLPKLPWE